MRIEYFKSNVDHLSLEKLKDDVNDFVDDLKKSGFKCVDIQIIFCGDFIIAFVKYEFCL